MTSRSAVVLVFLVVAIIAFCFAGVFAAMTGTYHFNFGNNTNQTPFFGNVSDSNSNSGHSSSDSHVETYSDSGHSSSNSHVETTEDTNPTPTPTPTPEPNPTPSDRNST